MNHLSRENGLYLRTLFAVRRFRLASRRARSFSDVLTNADLQGLRMAGTKTAKTAQMVAGIATLASAFFCSSDLFVIFGIPQRNPVVGSQCAGGATARIFPTAEVYAFLWTYASATQTSSCWAASSLCLLQWSLILCHNLHLADFEAGSDQTDLTCVSS
jgi:hypothetical protein